MEQLEDALGSVEIAQRMLTQITQAGSRRETVPSKILSCQGQQHLSAMARRKQTRQTIQPRSEIVPILRCGGGGMQRHADSNRSDPLGPRLLPQCLLGIERRCDRSGRSRE